MVFFMELGYLISWKYSTKQLTGICSNTCIQYTSWGQSTGHLCYMRLHSRLQALFFRSRDRMAESQHCYMMTWNWEDSVGPKGDMQLLGEVTVLWPKPPSWQQREACTGRHGSCTLVQWQCCIVCGFLTVPWGFGCSTTFRSLPVLICVVLEFYSTQNYTLAEHGRATPQNNSRKESTYDSTVTRWHQATQK